MDRTFRHGGDYFGYIPETSDALRLLQLAVRGVINIHRERLTSNKRDLITSGSVFILEESIELHRWTDGKRWSPSRSLGNFMIYKEVNGGSKIKRRQHQTRSAAASPVYKLNPNRVHYDPHNIELSLYGSLIDAYNFVEDGLVKKTFMGQYGERRFRIISYYKAEDVTAGRLIAPLDHPVLNNYPYDNDVDPYVTLPRSGNENVMAVRDVEPVHLQWPQPDYDQY